MRRKASRYEFIKKQSDAKFRRLTGVKRTTFAKMVELVNEKQPSKKGRPYKLSTENRVLMTLEYLREYRTYAHIASSYGVSETRAFENTRAIENILIKSKVFALPGKKALLTEGEYSSVLIDASESPIERPKKNSAIFTQERKKDTH